MAELPRRQERDSDAWMQVVGQVFQAEVEKAVLQGLTAAFRTLAERLPQLLAEVQQQPEPKCDAPPLPRVLRMPIEEPDSVAATAEFAAPAEATIVEVPAAEPCPEPAEPASLHLRRGMQAARAGETDHALAHFARALRVDPRAAPVYLARSRLLRRLGRTEESLADAEQALQLDPQLAPAYYLRAAACMRLGENTHAIADLTRFLELEPDHALGHHARGLAHANDGAYDRAISDFGRALRLRPQLLPARYHRAVAYRLKGEYVFAVAELTKILQAQPDFARAYFDRALARLALEEHDAAIEDLDRAVELAPQEEEFRLRRQQTVEAHVRSDAGPTRTESAGTEPSAPERSQNSPGGTGVPPVPPVSVEAEPNDPTFLPLSCPACGAAARISWKRLDRLFRCRKCARVFRVNREGHLSEIDPHAVRPRRAHWWKRGAVPVAALLLILVLAVCLYPRYRPKPALPELPNELAARGELWGKAWLADDRLMLRRLTSPAHDRQLHPWLTRHPPLRVPQGQTPSPPPGEEPSIQVRIQKPKTNEAVMILQITAASLKAPQEVRLDWAQRGETWYFVPTLKR